MAKNEIKKMNRISMLYTRIIKPLDKNPSSNLISKLIFIVCICVRIDWTSINQSQIPVFVMASVLLGLSIVIFKDGKGKGTDKECLKKFLVFSSSVLMVFMVHLAPNQNRHHEGKEGWAVDGLLFSEAFIDDFRVKHVVLKVGVSLYAILPLDFGRGRDFKVILLLITLGTLIIKIPLLLVNIFQSKLPPPHSNSKQSISSTQPSKLVLKSQQEFGRCKEKNKITVIRNQDPPISLNRISAVEINRSEIAVQVEESEKQESVCSFSRRSSIQTKSKTILKQYFSQEDKISIYTSSADILLLSDMNLRTHLVSFCLERHLNLYLNLRSILDLESEVSYLDVAKEKRNPEGKRPHNNLDCFLIDTDNDFHIDIMTALNFVVIRKVYKRLMFYEGSKDLMSPVILEYLNEIVYQFEQREVVSLESINSMIDENGLKWFLEYINTPEMSIKKEFFEYRDEIALTINLRKVVYLLQEYHEILSRLTEHVGFAFPGNLSFNFVFRQRFFVRVSMITSYGDSALHLVAGTASQISILEHITSKSRFFSLLINSLSHEIKTPIAKILMMIESCTDVQITRTGSPSPLETERGLAHKLSVVRQISSNLLLFVNGILNFAKVINKKIDIRPVQFNLSESIELVFRNFEYSLEDKQLPYFVDCKPKLEVVADREILVQILYILVENAVKFTTSGSIAVHVALQDDWEYCKFKVIDTGSGCSAEDLKCIQSMLHDPFSEKKKTKAAAGLGIGLRAAHALVMLMSEGKPSLRFVSKRGVGTTVEFIIPVTKPSEKAIVKVDLIEEEEIVKVGSMEEESVVARNNETPHQMMDKERGVSVQDERRKIFKNGFGLKILKTEGSRPGLNSSRKENHEKRRNTRMVSPDGDRQASSDFQAILHEISGVKPKPSKDFYRAVRHFVNNCMPKSSNDLNLQTQANFLEVPRSDDNFNDYGFISRRSTNIHCTMNQGQVKISEIMVVDDDPMITQLLKCSLSDFGIYIREVNSGEDAINVARKLMSENIKLNLVITDYNMGQMNGADLTRKLKSQEFSKVMSDAHVVMLTSQDEKSTRDECIRAGVDEFLSKPVQRDQLNELLRKYGIAALEK